MIARTLFFLAQILLFVACSSAPSDEAPTTPIPTNQIPGSVALSITGAISATEEQESRAEYGANTPGMRNPGNNQNGNLGLWVQSTTTDQQEIGLLLEFPSDIGIGDHAIGTNSDLSPEPIGAFLQVTGQPIFRQNVQGVLSLQQIDRRMITGSLKANFADADGRLVTVEASFYRLPYSPAEEFSIQISAPYQDVQAEPYFSRGEQGQGRFITLPFTIPQAFQDDLRGHLTLHADQYARLQPGTYPIIEEDSPVHVSVVFNDVEIPIQDGQILFTRTMGRINGVEESIWQGAVTLTLLTPAGAVQLSALFDHIDRH